MEISRTRRLSLLALLVAVLVTASIVAPASAATRHAAPGGSGTECSPAAPCEVSQALAGANAGDEVVAHPGDYMASGSVSVGQGVTLHGVAGEPRPRLLLSGGPSVILYQGATLRYVEVVQPANNNAIYSLAGNVDQAVVRATDVTFCGTTLQGGSIRNSIVVASGGGTAICTTGSTQPLAVSYRNVTAIATGNGAAAIEARAAGPGGGANLDLVNVIARGGPNGAGLDLTTDSQGGPAKITATHTNFPNYRTFGTNTVYVDGGGNEGTPPQFVNPAAGDYHQAPGSVTIGAGTDAPINGAFDVDGDPRKVLTTDIGADEVVVAPAATTGAAGAVTDQSATVSGSVDPKGAPTTYHFEYGPTTAYGRTTAATGAGSGTSAVQAGASLDGLAPETAYHYRLVSANAGGATKGADQTFTTTAAATSPGTPPPSEPTAPPADSPRPIEPTAPPTDSPPPAQPFAGVRLVSTRLSTDGRFIALKLSCAGATVGSCSGRTTLTTRRRRTASRAAYTVSLGSARFSIGAGSQAKIRVPVSRAGRRLLSRVRRLRGKNTNVARSGAGQSKTTVAAVTIRRR